MSISPQEAAIYVMVAMSAADTVMTDHELARIGSITTNMPFFDGFDPANLTQVAEKCADFLQSETGLDDLLKLVTQAVPESHHDLVYALAVDVAAADLNVEPEEIRFLQLLKDSLTLDDLTYASIERAAKARFRKAP